MSEDYSLRIQPQVWDCHVQTEEFSGGSGKRAGSRFCLELADSWCLGAERELGVGRGGSLGSRGQLTFAGVGGTVLKGS